MRFRPTAFIVSVVMLVSAASCGEKKSYTTADSTPKTYKEVIASDFADVPETETGPLLSVNNTKAHAGERAEVTLSVTGADMNWNMCGIHLTYPDEINLVLNEQSGEGSVLYKTGSALEYNSGFVSLIWDKNLPDELTEKHLGTFFFTTMFEGDKGLDGDIATFYFDIPDDAQSGTVYPIGLYYISSDMFRNSKSDKSFEKYAFEHFQAGSITVE